ncbi:MAG TPA: dephospho-CoA kinase, partial [Pseudomonadales bacterium]|nr:dephospho-CoA kinase [Pseudomonadales bacterium]
MGFVVGLTGGIGSGKSAVSDLFAARGITIADADVASRNVVMPGTPALDKIVAH